ncbi:hypothetical protein HU200_004254 [Digitaria exilis]|uniref:Uncharacterized protein n=1 Tax=Digitaria exilis TaxID=1010633 RepID=A0A835FTY7_9POAL|nr:hypothetical protein HU200_004254 [Digitaria exilis]
MSLLVPIIVALSLSLTVVVSSECPGARKNMTMEAACREACVACMDTLGVVGTPAGSVEEAGEYAYHATWRALEEKAAYVFCVGGRYPEAEAAMDRVSSRPNYLV